MQLTKIIAAAMIAIFAGIYVIINNSKEKYEYTKTEGTIVYLAKEYGQLPTRNYGKFRFLKIDNYPYIFEIFEPNSIPTKQTIDDLKVGDKIDIYYYEQSNIHDEGINRFTQFIDHQGIPYFIRDGFQKNAGYVVVSLGILMAVGSFALKKKGKIN